MPCKPRCIVLVIQIRPGVILVAVWIIPCPRQNNGGGVFEQSRLTFLSCVTVIRSLAFRLTRVKALRTISSTVFRANFSPARGLRDMYY
jgi:hypothetical protein